VIFLQATLIMAAAADAAGAANIRSMISRFRHSSPSSREDRAKQRERGELQELWYVRRSGEAAVRSSQEALFSPARTTDSLDGSPLRRHSPAVDRAADRGRSVEPTATTSAGAGNGSARARYKR
jgi:hypothetical protein